MIAGLERERAHHLVCARGVLDEHDPQLPLGAVGAGEHHALGASKRCARGVQSTGDVCERNADRGGKRRGGERVVDVVEARELE